MLLAFIDKREEEIYIVWQVFAHLYLYIHSVSDVSIANISVNLKIYEEIFLPPCGYAGRCKVMICGGGGG